MSQTINLSSLTTKTDVELQSIADALKSLSDKNKYLKIKNVFPDEGPFRRELYTPHLEFMAAGLTHRFRVFTGGNRSGKSFTIGTELTFHCTGEYPKWWTGKVLRKPTTVWIVGESGALYRDSLQKLLFGNPGEEVGTGLLPLASKNNGVGIIDWAYMPGTPNGIGSCTIRHTKGHVVSIVVKTNEMSREQFQAAKVSLVVFDEEPREDIYVECLMRLMGAGTEPGIAMLAFTPLKGLSNVVLRFLPNGQFPDRGCPIDDPERYICRVEWQDVPHLSEQDKKDMLSEIPLNEQDARTKGIPTLGSGRVYPTDEKFVFVPAFKIPDYWPRAYGYDFGWHATAAVWVAQDPVTKVKYVYAEYKQGKVADYVHAQNVKAKGDWIPGVADPSGGGRRDDGTLKIEYMTKVLGLKLIPGYNALNTGIGSLVNDFESGQTKIFDHLEGLKKEYRLYKFDIHDPNKPARNQEDHELDALRYCLSRFDDVAVSQEEHDYPYDDTDYGSDNTRDKDSGY